MNLQDALIAALAWLASALGAAWLGYGLGQDAEVAAQARVDKAVAKAADATASAAVAAINAQKPKHVITKQTIEREIRTVPDLTRCSSGADSVRDFNAAIPPEPGAPRGGVPTPAAPG